MTLKTPAVGEALPTLSDVADPDTRAAAYRPTFRSQFNDGSESNYNHPPESASQHCSGNCTAASGAMALDFHTNGSVQKRGGDMRHHQSDLDGGIDLYDLQRAWKSYGYTLEVWSGRGWSAVQQARREKRAVVLQGVSAAWKSGCSTGFKGSHCIIVLPENTDNGDWVKGDPICSGWSHAPESEFKDFAQRFSSSISFAVTGKDTGGESGGQSMEFNPKGTFVGSVKFNQDSWLYRVVDGVKVNVAKDFDRHAYSEVTYPMDGATKDGYLVTFKEEAHIAPASVVTPTASGGSSADVAAAVKAENNLWWSAIPAGNPWPPKK